MPNKTILLLIGLVAGLALAACSVFGGDDEKTLSQEDIPMSIQLTSAAFAEGDLIPAAHARQGQNVSPPLVWSGAPAGTVSFALIMDDPDAPRGTWVHWVVYNLPADAAALPAGIGSDADLPGDAAHGKNDWGETAYGGPQPPSGTHRYFFKLYALDTVLDLRPGATKNDTLAAMDGHVLAEGQLMGRYRR